MTQITENAFFNPARFGMLLNLHWMENRKKYLLGLLAIGGLIFAWYAFMLTMDDRDPFSFFVQFTTYYCGLYFVGCLYASTLFSPLGSKAYGIHFLSVPASHFEKLLCAILFGVFLFFIAYTLIFYVVDIPMVHLANRVNLQRHGLLPGNKEGVGTMEVYNMFTENGLPVPEIHYHIFSLGFFAVQSTFILGSVYFIRYGFIKTIVSVLFFFSLEVIFYVKGVMDHVVPEGWHQDGPLRWMKNNTTPETGSIILLPHWFEITLIILLQFGLPFVFWFITYFRLKEKEL